MRAHPYRRARRAGDLTREKGNRCGQLAVAIALELIAERAAGVPADPVNAPGVRAGADETARLEAMAEGIARTHPPDVPLGFGTSAFRVRAALEDRGIPAHIVHSGAFGRPVRQVWDLVRRTALSRMPVIVCLDAGRLGGRRWHGHWCVVTGVGDDLVEIANPVGKPHVRFERFHAAWACRYLPWPHHHCAVIPAAPPRPWLAPTPAAEVATAAGAPVSASVVHPRFAPTMRALRIPDALVNRAE
jgi:hypothetical protein